MVYKLMLLQFNAGMKLELDAIFIKGKQEGIDK